MQNRSGSCGKNLLWRLEGETLIISGQGPMEDFLVHRGHNHWTASFDAHDLSPWKSNCGENRMIRRLIVEDGVTSIGEFAFGSTDIIWRDREGNFLHYSNQHQYLESVWIADSVTVIEENAFARCTALKEVVLPASLRKISGRAFCDCEMLEELNIPNCVEEIDADAFRGTPFHDRLRQQEGLVVLGNCAYLYQGTESRIVIPDGIKTIGYQLFQDCKFLTEISFPPSVKKIACGAFQGCTALRAVDIPKNVNIIGGWAFYGCSEIERIDIPEKVETIGFQAFAKCKKLSQVTLLSEDTSFRKHTFEETPWWQMQRGSVIANRMLIGYFGDSSRYIIPTEVKNIANEAIINDRIEELVIPESVEKMEGGACKYCTALKTLHLPENLQLLQPECLHFRHCSQVSRIYYGKGKILEVNGIVNLGLAGENVAWLEQNDGTVILFGKGTVDYKMLVYSTEEEFTDIGSYREYYYVWTGRYEKRWMTKDNPGKIMICKGVKLPQPFPKTLPIPEVREDSIDAWDVDDETNFFFTVLYPED